MELKSYKLDSTSARAVIIAATVVFAAAAVISAKWMLGNSIAIRADNIEVARLAAELAPGDPQSHFSTAVILEKNFTAEDIERSLTAYETAVSLSPNDYLLWLELGRARERNGDQTGAELALRQAALLAPHYSRVQWALGNALLRQGKAEEAFAEIGKAVDGDPAFTRPAVTTAWQIYEGDIAAVRRTLGDSPRLSAALAELLATQKRFDEAFEIWNSLPADEKRQAPNAAGDVLLRSLVEAKQFRKAHRVWADLTGAQAAVGTISNGGFEFAVKIQNAGVFEWQLGSGTQPQIAQTSGQKRSGENSLVLIYNSSESKDLRSISQMIAVEPGGKYELNLFYRADLKTRARFGWEAVDQGGNVLGKTGPIENSSDWQQLSAKFAVPAGTDGVIIRLAREGCGPVVCIINGNIWFDDIEVKAVDQ